MGSKWPWGHRKMAWTVADTVKATGGHLLQGSGETPLAGFSTDTRSIEAGACFLALAGERHDGHAYIGDALSKGAAGAIVQIDKAAALVPFPQDAVIIGVPDTLRALGDLAGAHRRRFRIPLVGITGSNGKTSTKEMVAAILSQGKRVLKNKGNFNNLIGVPLTLLTLESDHQAAVVEMGINVPGEMSRLVEITQPDIGLITNIHPAHLEGLCSEQQILAEKGKLWEGLGDKGLAVVNRDDERLWVFSRRIAARAIVYSMRDGSAEVALTGPVEMGEGSSVFRLRIGGKTMSVRLSVLGEHQVGNAIAAAAVAWAMKVPAEEIAEGLSIHRPVHQRMEMHVLKDGRVIIDDTYNANPRSMVAAVRTVCQAGRGNRVVAVLGDMKELGPETQSLHLDVGRAIGSFGVGELITFGEMSREIARGAREVGMPSDVCYHAASHEEIVERLMAKRLSGEWILIKGSRSMTMERVVEKLLNAERYEPAA